MSQHEATKQIPVCTEKNNMASKFEKTANFEKQYLLQYEYLEPDTSRKP